VVGATSVSDDDELMLISDQGTLVRTPVAGVSVIGRNTQGIRLISLAKSESLIGIAPIADLGGGDDEADGEDATDEPDSGSDA